MNILIVTQYFWPESFRVNDLALGLKERNYKVTVLTGIPNYPEGEYFDGYGVFNKRIEDYHDIKVVRVPLVSRGKGGRFRLAVNYLSFLLFACILGPFYCREKYDLIFAYQLSPITACFPAIVLKIMKQTSMTLYVQDLWPESVSAVGAINNKWLLKILEYFVKFIYSMSDLTLVQSKAFLPAIEKLGVNKEKASYLPNSIEDYFKSVQLEPDAPERKIIPNGFCIMFAGNIGAAQDFNTILAAAEKLKEFPDIHWVILGDGRARLWVKEQIGIRGLTNNIHLLGKHPPEEMPRFFSMADVMLVTLKKNPIFALTVPSKVQAYLACAKPIIAALDGEGAKVINDAGAGLTCSAEDPVNLADAVLKTYHMRKEELQKMGESGKNYFDKYFSREMLLDNLDNWIKQVVEKKHKKKYNT